MTETGFEARDPAYEARIRGSFARQQFMATIGAVLDVVLPGFCEISARHDPGLTQQHGFFHGGLIGTLADTAAGYAAYTLMAADSSVLSIEYKINFMAPAHGERLIARGRVIRPGRQIHVARADVFAVEEGVEKQVSTATVTLICLAGRDDFPQDQAAEKKETRS